jgi:hypothetical protein
MVKPMPGKPIVVVGRSTDPSVQLLLEAWRDRPARLLAPPDLASPGIVHDPSDPARDRVVVEGQVMDAAAIGAVVVWLQSIQPFDLPRLREIDRAYAAGEATAFLMSWLASLACPVVNRPWGGALGGPGLSHGRWVRLAVQQGLAVEPAEVEAALHAPAAGQTPSRRPAADPASIVVVGGEEAHAAGPAHPALIDQARRLARDGGADVAELRFAGHDAGAPFLSAGLLPALTAPVAASIASLIEARSAAAGGGGAP